MKSSTRNQLTGRISAIEEHGGSCLITVTADSGIQIQAQISSFSRGRLKLAAGMTVAAMFKAAAVAIVTDLEPMVLSAENCLPGTVKKVEQGAVNNVVTLDIGGGLTLCATITLYSSETLSLCPGKAAVAVFNANQVVLGVLV